MTFQSSLLFSNIVIMVAALCATACTLDEMTNDAGRCVKPESIVDGVANWIQKLLKVVS